MEQQTQSDPQESVQFGEVDPTADQLILNDYPDNSPPLIGIFMLWLLKKTRNFLLCAIEQEIAPVNRTQQETPVVVNYGPCVICNVNERCVVFVGCNHLACCGQCSTACNDICPVIDCNHPIRERLHVFKPWSLLSNIFFCTRVCHDDITLTYNQQIRWDHREIEHLKTNSFPCWTLFISNYRRT